MTLTFSGAPTAAQSPAAVAPEGVRINENIGAFVYDGSGDTRQASRATVSAADLRTDQQRAGSILSTARNALDIPVPASQITPDTLVDIGGMQATIASAEREGLIAKNAASGMYEEVPQSNAGAPEEKPQDTSADQGEPLADDGAEVMLAEAVATLPATDQVRALSGLIENGTVPTDLLKAGATARGVSDAEMSRQVGTILDQFTAQAAAAVTALGVPEAEAFFAWCHKERPNAMRESMLRHGMERTTAGYKALAEEYMSNLDRIAPEMLPRVKLVNGASLAEVNGRAVVRRSGTPEMTFGVAYKNGLVARV